MKKRAMVGELRAQNGLRGHWRESGEQRENKEAQQCPQLTEDLQGKAGGVGWYVDCPASTPPRQWAMSTCSQDLHVGS